MNRSVFNIQAYAKFTISILLSFGLAACGGGSSETVGPPPTSTSAVAINATNAPTVASTAIQNPANVMAGSSLSGSPLAVNTLSPRMLSRFALDAKPQTLRLLSAPRVSPALVETTNCLISGSKTIDAATDGTSIAITFNNCSDTTGQVVNGSMSLTNIVISATSFSATSSIDLTITTTGYPTVSFVGTYNFATTDTATESTLSLTGSSYSITVGSNVTTLSNFSFTETYTLATDLYSSTSNYTLASTELGGSVTVTTIDPIQQYGSRLYPFAGQYTVTGANNSKIRVTILGDETHAGDDILIELDENGDNTYETTILRDWNAL